MIENKQESSDIDNMPEDAVMKRAAEIKTAQKNKELIERMEEKERKHQAKLARRRQLAAMKREKKEAEEREYLNLIGDSEAGSTKRRFEEDDMSMDHSVKRARTSEPEVSYDIAEKAYPLEAKLALFKSIEVTAHGIRNTEERAGFIYRHFVKIFSEPQ